MFVVIIVVVVVDDDDDGALEVFIKGLDYLDQFLGDSILIHHNDSKAVFVYGIESLFEVNKVDVQNSIPFVDLFQNIPEDEYLVNSSSACPKAGLFLPKTTTTTTVYFNEVVFPSVLGSTLPMAFPQHSPPP